MKKIEKLILLCKGAENAEFENKEGITFNLKMYNRAMGTNLRQMDLVSKEDQTTWANYYVKHKMADNKTEGKNICLNNALLELFNEAIKEIEFVAEKEAIEVFKTNMDVFKGNKFGDMTLAGGGATYHVENYNQCAVSFEGFKIYINTFFLDNEVYEINEEQAESLAFDNLDALNATNGQVELNEDICALKCGNVVKFYHNDKKGVELYSFNILSNMKYCRKFTRKVYKLAQKLKKNDNYILVCTKSNGEEKRLSVNADFMDYLNAIVKHDYSDFKAVAKEFYA